MILVKTFAGQTLESTNQTHEDGFDFHDESV